jgi:death-on-curing protein
VSAFFSQIAACFSRVGCTETEQAKKSAGNIVSCRTMSVDEKAFAGFGRQEFYPTKEEKGVRLGNQIISNHAFVDGGKRIGMYVMPMFLEVNGSLLECTNGEIAEAGLAVSDGWMSCEELRDRAIEHKKQKIF